MCQHNLNNSRKKLHFRLVSQVDKCRYVTLKSVSAGPKSDDSEEVIGVRISFKLQKRMLVCTDPCVGMSCIIRRKTYGVLHQQGLYIHASCI